MNPITTLNVDLGDGVFVTNRPANFTRQMTYNELINDQLTLQELSLVSGRDKGPECKKKLIEVVWRNVVGLGMGVSTWSQKLG